MSQWIRIIPTSAKRPTPTRYMLANPSGGFRYEAGHIYEVNDDIAKYLCQPGLIDGDANSYPIFEAFPTKDAALRKTAQEHGILPTMIDPSGSLHEEESVAKPLDPRNTKALATPGPRGGPPHTIQSAPSRAGQRAPRPAK